MSDQNDVTRAVTMLEFHRQIAVAGGGVRRWPARAQNFSVEWVEADEDGAEVRYGSACETMLLVFGQPIQVTRGDAEPVAAPARSVCIVAPGQSVLRMAAGGICVVLASQRDDLDLGQCINADLFRQPDPRIKTATPAFARVGGDATVQVIAVDAFAAPVDNPRLKMLQSSTLSINWVDYDGPRDRRALSPHSHADLEQGSLAVAGRFVHHLRQRWGKDANAWRDDQHPTVDSPSLMVVPVNLIHTSEGVGDGHHLLIDIFSPPRRDFIAKGWVYNAADYRDMSQ